MTSRTLGSPEFFAHIQGSNVDVDLEGRRLAQAEAVERQAATLDLSLIGEVDALAFLGLREATAQRCGQDQGYQHSFCGCFHVVSRGGAA